MPEHSRLFLLVIIVATMPVGQALGQITEFDLTVVESPALDGKRFGKVGQYERLRGIVTGEVNPSDPRHHDIVNLSRAPRNTAGQVEYRTIVEIYRPIDMEHWNRAIYHTVSNRGGAGAAETSLLERGFAFVRIGWQGDLKPTSQNIVAMLPVATEADGSPVAGIALEEFIFNDRDHQSRPTLTYPAASLNPEDATLTVRATQGGQRATPEDMHWRFVSPTEIEITRPTTFDGGAIYEFIYNAKDPIVLGLGFAAMRDAISFLRYEDGDPKGHRNPLAAQDLANTVISLGRSQSGRALRDFVYQGFNEDVSGRIVFDGIHPNIAGSRKTFTNYQFGQPGRWQKQHEDHLYPGDQFPFTYATLTDPVSGQTDGLLERCLASNTCPNVIHSDGEAELWQARASLIVTDPVGRHIELPSNVRVYLLAGTQHGGGPGVHTRQPSQGICQNLSNPLAMGQTRVALSLALYEWVQDGIPPPPSSFPTVANGGLVAATAIDFPDIPAVTYSASYNPLFLTDHTTVPPTRGENYTVLVGQTDSDGNMFNGVRHPNLAVPIGTYTGWNLRRAGYASGAQCGGTGSFIPFAETEKARQTAGDPRPSLEARYSSQADYVAKLSQIANELVQQRLLLTSDAEDIIERARRSRHWTQD